MKSNPYYDVNRVSNSDLTVFMKNGPKYFKRYKDKLISKEEPSYFQFGTMVHGWLLQPDEFWQDYKLIADYEAPANAKQKAFIQQLAFNWPLSNTKAGLIDAYQANFVEPNPDKAFEKAGALMMKLTPYLNYVLAEATYIPLTQVKLGVLNKIRSNVDNNKAAKLLLNNEDGWEYYNEKAIYWDYELRNGNLVECKSSVDRYGINHEQKKVRLIDLKTCHAPYDFRSHFEEFEYNRQLAYYTLAICKEHPECIDYTFEYYIIAIGNSDDYEVRVLSIPMEVVAYTVGIIDYILNEIGWHYEHDKWNHSRGYYENEGIEYLYPPIRPHNQVLADGDNTTEHGISEERTETV
jgi:hypothetical protein